MGKTLDFSNVQSNEPLAEGMYELDITKVEEKQSQSGKDMILVTFKHQETGTAIWENYVLQENCLWKLKELLDAVGIDTQGTVDLDFEELVGQTVNAKVTQEEYNGQMKNRIQKVYAC
jgi:hypothetical protein